MSRNPHRNSTLSLTPFAPNLTSPRPFSEIWIRIVDTAPLPPLPSFFDALLLPSPENRYTCPPMPSPEFAKQLHHTALQLVYRCVRACGLRARNALMRLPSSNGSSGNWHAFIKRACSCFEQLHLQEVRCRRVTCTR